MNYSIDYFCTSHIGNLRSVNQDNFICVSKYIDSENNKTVDMISGSIHSSMNPVFGVFDGMGGEECGEVASYIAAKRIAGYSFDGNPEQNLFEYCKVANAEICSYTDEHSLTSMGTTAAILLFAKKKIYLCNIGDSKIFRLSQGELNQISYDHISVSAYGTKPPLTQNLGIKETELIISPYIAHGDYQDHDIYLICSDGLSDMVDMVEIKEILMTREKKNAAQVLLQKALEHGGKDNITILLLYIAKERINILSKIRDRIKKTEV